MQVREAVADAKKYIQEIFSDEKISALGLEEVEFDETARVWCIMLGFSCPWDASANDLATIARQFQRPPRLYKVVRISDATGQLVSIKNREPTDAG